MVKLLLDENVAVRFKNKLKKYKVIENIKHINDFDKKGLPDDLVYDLAKRENRIILTGDDDFKEKNKCTGVIWMTPNARLDNNVVEKIIWIINNINNYNIDIYDSFIKIGKLEYEIHYKKKSKSKIKIISFRKIKDFRKE